MLKKKLFEMDSKLTKCAVKKTIHAFLTNTISKNIVARTFFITMAVIQAGKIQEEKKVENSKDQ